MKVLTPILSQNFTDFTSDYRPFLFNQELNSEKIQSHYKDDLSFCMNMFEVCLHSVPYAVSDMDDAIEHIDYIALSTITDKLKSNFELVSHTEMVQLLNRLDVAAKQKSNLVFDLYLEFKKILPNKLDLIKNEIIRISQYIKMN